MRPNHEPGRKGLFMAPWAAFCAGGGVIVLLLAVAELTPGAPTRLLDNAVFKTGLLAVSLLFMAVDGRGFRSFGFTRARAPRWRRAFLLGVLLGAGTTLAILLTPAEGMNLLGGATLPELVLTIWLWSSFTEEVFTRGLIQGWVRNGEIENSRPPGGGRFSAPVLTSGLLFGAMHFSLFLRGTDPWTVAIVVIGTTALGILAAQIRERSGSLWPPVVTHIAFNVGGFFAGVVYFISQKLLT